MQCNHQWWLRHCGHPVRAAGNVLMVVGFLGLVACGDREEAGKAAVASADPFVTPEDTLKPKTDPGADQNIGKRLYDQKLAAVPEVQRAMTRHVRMYQEGRMPREVAMSRFSAWLELWVKAHPNAAELAAEASKPPEFAREPQQPKPSVLDAPQVPFSGKDSPAAAGGAKKQ